MGLGRGTGYGTRTGYWIMGLGRGTGYGTRTGYWIWD